MTNILPYASDRRSDPEARRCAGAHALALTVAHDGPVPLPDAKCSNAGERRYNHFSEIDISTGSKVPDGCEATMTSVMFATR
jgi:hypothetical protein